PRPRRVHSRLAAPGLPRDRVGRAVARAAGGPGGRVGPRRRDERRVLRPAGEAARRRARPRHRARPAVPRPGRALPARLAVRRRVSRARRRAARDHRRVVRRRPLHRHPLSPEGAPHGARGRRAALPRRDRRRDRGHSRAPRQPGPGPARGGRPAPRPDLPERPDEARRGRRAQRRPVELVGPGHGVRRRHAPGRRLSTRLDSLLSREDAPADRRDQAGAVARRSTSDRRSVQAREMTSSQPLTFSVIVNTIDRAEPLRTLLCALEHQTYPHFEVIAVVGPTRDRTLDVLADYGDRVEVLRCAAANLSASRNVGLLAARGDVAAFIDDDAVPSRRWLEQLAVLFEDEELNGTGGMVYCVHPSMPAVQHRIGVVSCLAEQTDVRSSCADGLPPPGVGRQWTPRMMGTNMAYRRDRLLAVGGFDEFFEWVYDDADVAIRLASSGHPVEPVKEAVVYPSPASSRNRKAYSWNFRSWVQTKSVVYFMMKNGRVAGESARTIAYRCARFVHGRWILGGNLRREGNLGWIASSRMRALEMMGGAQGAWHGLRDRRRLIPPEVAAGAAGRRSAIRAFPNASSPCAPSVDPVAARPLATSLPEPPLRLCLLSHSYPPFEIEGVGRHTSLMARGLAELGHTVHVVTRGDREQTTFRDGAYVHRIKP